MTEKDGEISTPGVSIGCANGVSVLYGRQCHMLECVERFCLNSRSNLTSGLNLFHHLT
jgi:hypothetical protein